MSRNIGGSRQVMLPALALVLVMAAAALLLAVTTSASALTPTPSNTPPRPATTVPPPPVGTPWPAPTGLTVGAGPQAITGPGGAIIPPEQRAYEAIVSWDVAPRFAGRYELQRAQRPRGGTGALDWTNAGTRPASEAADGRMRVVAGLTFDAFLNGQTCFRVRTVTDGFAAPPAGSGSVPRPLETGPWAEACSELPPVTRPAPLAPAVGSGHSGGSTPGIEWVLIAGALASAGAGGLAWARAATAGRR